MKKINKLFLLILLLPGLPLAETGSRDTDRVMLTVKGEYRYGPNVSEQEACGVAVQRAKEDALRQVFGEVISADEQFSCREKTGTIENRQCAYDKSTWSIIDGEIGNAVQEKKLIFEEDGAKRCWVELKVDVIKPTKKPGLDLDLRVNLGAYQYKSGDNLTIEVVPPKPTVRLSKSAHLLLGRTTPKARCRWCKLANASFMLPPACAIASRAKRATTCAPFVTTSHGPNSSTTQRSWWSIKTKPCATWPSLHVRPICAHNATATPSAKLTSC
jgi:hypothetical protein